MQPEGEERPLLPVRNRAAREANRLVHIAAWLGLAWLLLHLSRLPEVVLRHDERVNWIAVYCGAICVAFNCAAMFYLIVIEPCRGRVIHDYFAYAPATIVAVSAAAVGSWFCFVIGFWPIWGLATPPMFVVFYFAFVFAVSLIPAWGPCRGPPEDEPGEEDMAAAREEMRREREAATGGAVRRRPHD